MADLSLRPYQLTSIEALRAGFAVGHKRQILCAATGAGKTICATHLLQEAQRKRTRAIVLVDRIVLCTQFSNTLDEYGVHHGIIQAGNPRWRSWEKLHICTVQTLARRGFPGDVGLLVIDEAHVLHNAAIKFLADNPEIPCIGLTATPLTAALGKTFTNLVNVTTHNQLIAEGYLVPLKVYAAKAIDMKGAKIVAGEWSADDIAQRGSRIIGDIVTEWVEKTQKHFGGPVKTLVFSATVPHGEELCRHFRAAGYNFQQISYRDGSDESRAQTIAEFRKPDSTIHGLVSCEVLVKGADFPDIRCLIAARPYRKSLVSHIQQIGRGLRPYPGKQFCLLLDHALNCIRFRERTEEIFEHGIHELDMGDKPQRAQREPTKEEIADIACKCGFILAPTDKTCPGCGREIHRRSLVEVVPGRLVEMEQRGLNLEETGLVWRQLCSLGIERKHGDLDAARRFALAQYRNLFKSWPAEPFQEVCVEVPMRLRAKVKANIIRYAKGREKHARQAASA